MYVISTSMIPAVWTLRQLHGVGDGLAYGLN